MSIWPCHKVADSLKCFGKFLIELVTDFDRGTLEAPRFGSRANASSETERPEIEVAAAGPRYNKGRTQYRPTPYDQHCSIPRHSFPKTPFFGVTIHGHSSLSALY